MTDKAPFFKMISLAIFSAVSIAYEIFVMRAFSIGNWSNFGFLVISTALLGFGLAGTLLCYFSKSLKANPGRWIGVTGSLFGPSMVMGFVIVQQIPFNPIFLTSGLHQLLWIGLYYLLYGIPFFIIALFIGVMFVSMSSRINRLYFWNMAGSGLGGLLILVFMYFIPPQFLMIPLLLLSVLAAIFGIVETRPEAGVVSINKKYLVANIILLVASLAAVVFLGEIKVSEFKSISYVRNYPDEQVIHHSYSPQGELHVFSSSRFHSAPGSSDIAIYELNEIPKQDFAGLFTDGDGPFLIMGELIQSQAAYMDYLPMAAPYMILQNPDVLLANLNGGISAQLALYKNARQVTIAEPNYELVNLLKDTPTIMEYNDNLFHNDKISIQITNPRAWCASHTENHDLIEISLIDSIGSVMATGQSVHENFTYTRESISAYMNALSDDGILSITVWNGLIPPRNVPKILTTVITTLCELGFTDISKHLFAFDLHRSTATILVKKSPFLTDELDKLVKFVTSRAFDLVYYDGMPPVQADPKNIMAVYRNFYTNEVSSAESTPEFKSCDFYHFLIKDMLSGREAALYQEFVFDITPMTDDRPYYSVYLKPAMFGHYIDQMRDIMEEWGFVLIIGVLIQSILFGALIIFIPMANRFKALFEHKRTALRVIIYFSCLGIGYMFMEIFLIQKLTFFLSDPTYSTSIVLTSMLVLSGIGSITSGKFKLASKSVVRLAVAGIVICTLFYLFGLSPLLNALLDSHFALKLVISILVIAPAAFFLGMPFPNGLRSVGVDTPQLLPWAWGMNGAFSVTGTVLSRLLSITLGFSSVLAITAAVYLMAAIFFPWKPALHHKQTAENEG